MGSLGIRIIIRHPAATSVGLAVRIERDLDISRVFHPIKFKDPEYVVKKMLAPFSLNQPSDMIQDI